MEAAGVGIADGVEPVHGLLFGVGVEASKRSTTVRSRRVLLESGDLVGGRRKAGEVEGDAADERAAVGFRSGGEPRPGEAWHR